MVDEERNRFSARAARYARVGANVGGVAARIAGARLMGLDRDGNNAAALASALGGLKGPLMKVAQLMATIPDVLPPEYAAELQKLQSDAPPMGWAFVRRRMMAELGADWAKRFTSFEHEPAHAASLGALSRRVATIAELEDALDEARDADRTSVIVIDTDPLISTPTGGNWWEVVVPEVSERAQVREARAGYEAALANQRLGD